MRARPGLVVLLFVIAPDEGSFGVDFDLGARLEQRDFAVGQRMRAAACKDRSGERSACYPANLIHALGTDSNAVTRQHGTRLDRWMHLSRAAGRRTFSHA